MIGSYPIHQVNLFSLENGIPNWQNNCDRRLLFSPGCLAMRYFLVGLVCLSIPLGGDSPCVAQQNYTRQEIVDAVGSAHTRIEKGFHVRYVVNQKVKKSTSPDFMVHVGRDRWWGEHAYLDDGKQKFLHRTLDSKIDPESKTAIPGRFFDGEVGVLLTAESPTAQIFRGEALAATMIFLKPDEELFHELIGFESGRQDIGFTIRGFENPNPYDLREVLGDDTYVMKKPGGSFGENIILFEKKGFERIWIDANLGFSVVQRERNWEPNGPLRVTFVNSDFEKVDGEIFLPQSSLIKYYGSPKSNDEGRVSATATLKVESATLNPDKALFELPEDKLSGLLDVNKANAGLSHVRMAPIGEEGVAAFLDAAAKERERKMRGLLGSRRNRIWQIAFLIGLVGIAAYILFKRSTASGKGT